MEIPVTDEGGGMTTKASHLLPLRYRDHDGTGYSS